MRSSSILIPCLLLPLSFGCSSDETTAGDEITALVTDAAGNPVSGVRVSFHANPAVVTGDDGRASTASLEQFTPCEPGAGDGQHCEVTFGVIADPTSYRMFAVTGVALGETVRYVIDEPEDPPASAGELAVRMPEPIAGQASASLSVCGAVTALAIGQTTAAAEVFEGCENAEGEYVALALALDGTRNIIGSSILAAPLTGDTQLFPAFATTEPREFSAANAADFGTLEVALPAVTARGSRLPLLDPLDLRGAVIAGGSAAVTVGFPRVDTELTSAVAALSSISLDGTMVSNGKVIVSASPDPVALDAGQLLPVIQLEEAPADPLEPALLSDASTVTGAFRTFTWTREVDEEAIVFELTVHAEPESVAGVTSLPFPVNLHQLALPDEAVSWEATPDVGLVPEQTTLYRLPAPSSFADARALFPGRFDQAVRRLDAPIELDIATFIKVPPPGTGP